MDKNKCLEIVNKDADAIYIGNLNTVEFDLNLPSKGKYGSAIKWKSGHDRIISDEGIITRPVYGKGNRTVPLHAIFTYGEAEIKKIYQVRVLQEENKIRIARIFPVIIKAQKNTLIYLPTVVVVKTEDGKVIPHAVTWNGSTEKKYEEIGIYEQFGVIKDTEIPVTAQIEVSESLNKEIISKEPRVNCFSSEEVRLEGDSCYKQAQDRNCEYLLKIDDNQMLYNFRKAAGLDTLGAPEMIGWDAPDSLLRGHTTGHYLSALALCYAATKNGEIRKKAEYMITSLEECQNQFSVMEGFHEGFLSGYSEEQFDLLEKYTLYPEIWAPYYTLHKIFAGLLDCYEYMHQEMALKVADRLGDWVYNRLSKLTHQQLCDMWAIYIAGEFGGMNDVMSRLYRYTEKKEHIETAYLFDNDKLFYPMENEIDALDTLHANQHIPQIIGAMKIFEVTGEKRYFDIAKFFWNIVTKEHVYSIGGTGEGEMFHAPQEIAMKLSKHTAESCASYNMLKLTHELFKYQPKSYLMDYYERTMVNHILSSNEKKPTGASTYFMPLAPGFKKEYDDENSCCHGTGLESHFKYAKDVFFKSENSIYVNLFVPSKVRWEEKETTLTLIVNEDRPEEICILLEGTNSYDMKIRKPYWCKEEPIIKIDGNSYQDFFEEDGYLVISRKWKSGEKLSIHYACGLKLEEAPDDKSKVSVLYGPYVLAALTDKNDFIDLNSNGLDIETLFEKESDSLKFRLKSQNIDFIPLFQVNYELYQIYMNK